MSRLILSILLMLSLGALSAQPQAIPSDKKTDQGAAPPMAKGSTESGMFAGLPGGSILVLCEQAVDSLRLFPKMVVLSPEKFQEMQDEIKKFKEQALKPAIPIIPSAMKITGKLDANQARLKVRYSFVVDTPGSQVNLAMGNCQALSAVIAGKTPVLKKTTEGFVLRSEEPGTQEAEIEFVAQVRQGNGIFVLGLELPGCAITQMDLDLPLQSIQPKLDNKTSQEPWWNFQNNRLSASIGNSKTVELRWESAPKTNMARALTAETNILVKLDDRYIRSQAQMKIGSTGGRLDMLEILVPLGCEVRGADPLDDAKILRIEKEEFKFHGVRKIFLKEGASPTLKLTLDSQSPVTSNGATQAIGPFYLVHAVRQTGTILLSDEGTDLKYQPLLRGDIDTQEIPALERSKNPKLASAFRFWNHPFAEKPSATIGQNSLSLLDLQTNFVRGELEVKSVLQARLAQDQEARWVWQLNATLECTPLRTGVEKLEVLVPKGMRYDREKGALPTSLVREDSFDEKTGKLSLIFDKEQSNPFQITLAFTQDAQKDQTESLPLPIPLNARDRGSQITVICPDAFHLLPDQKKNPGLELASLESNRLIWKSDRFAQKVVVVRRVTSEKALARHHVDLFFDGAEVFARHSIRIESPRAMDPLVNFQWEGVAPRGFKVSRGGTMGETDADGKSIQLLLKPDPVRGYSVDLDYRLPGKSMETITLPLLYCKGADNPTQIRIWSPMGTSVECDVPSWVPQPPSASDQYPRLPNATFFAASPAVPFTFKIQSRTGTSPFASTAIGLARFEAQSVRLKFLYQVQDSLESKIDFTLPTGATLPRLWINLQESNLQFRSEGSFQIALPPKIPGPDPATVVELEYSVPLAFDSWWWLSLAAPRTSLSPPQLTWLVLPTPDQALLWPGLASVSSKKWKPSGWFFEPGYASDISALIAPFQPEKERNAAQPVWTGLIFQTPYQDLTVVVFSKFWFPAALSFIVIPMALLLVWKFQLASWLRVHGVEITLGGILGVAILFCLSEELAQWVIFGVQPALVALLAGMVIHGMVLAGKRMTAPKAHSFAPSGKAPSTIQLSSRGISSATPQRKSDSKATGYWVRPDPSTPSAIASNAPDSASVQNSLPD